MQLTEKQIDFIIGFAVLFIFSVGLLYILRAIYRLIKRTVKTAILKKKRHSWKQRKGLKGYKNYQNDTWYPNGNYWNEKTKKWEKPDFRK